MNNINKLLDRAAVAITSAVGTMWCAIGFAALAIIGFPYGANDLTSYVQWFSQTFIQLVMLSVIMVGQNLLSDKHDQNTATMSAIHAAVTDDNE
jgi:hypothetical protein